MLPPVLLFPSTLVESSPLYSIIRLSVSNIFIGVMGNAVFPGLSPLMNESLSLFGVDMVVIDIAASLSRIVVAAWFLW